MENKKPEGQSFTPPWSRIDALQDMTFEAGIDFDSFIQSIHDNKSIDEMASEYQVQSATIESLQDHFFRYGISSVIGGD